MRGGQHAGSYDNDFIDDIPEMMADNSMPPGDDVDSDGEIRGGNGHGQGHR